jgi:Arc/MetJ family transcription regulator
MRSEYDFSKARRGPVVVVPKGKTRITIRLDDDLLEWFKRRVTAAGGGNYQTMINEALHHFVTSRDQSMEVLLRRVVREELRRMRGPKRARGTAEKRPAAS